jgi:hypothetical protein
LTKRGKNKIHGRIMLVSGFRDMLSVTKSGEVAQAIVDKIVSTLDECYKIIGEPMADSVDLRIVEKSVGGTFFATHDALSGKPTLTVYMDKFLEMPQLVGLAGIRRQAAHSVLHGSLEYYLIRVPKDLIRAMKRYNLSHGYTNAFLYNIGMAAKEYGVTRLLYGKNFVEDQVAYAKYILDPSIEEALAWEIALRNRLEKTLYLTSIIRDVSCAVPLVRDEQFGDGIKDCIGKRLAYITPVCQSKIQKIIYERFSLLDTNTFRNIALITGFLVDEIIDYELADWL